MRTITLAQIAVFAVLALAAAALAVATALIFPGRMHLGDFRGVAVAAGTIIVFLLYSIVLYRLFLRVAPLQEGTIVKGSRQEFVYHVYELFQLVLFHSLTRSHVVPVPLMRLIYQGLGARFGTNSYSGGTLLDPPLTSMGSNCIVGHDAVLFCHAVEGENLSLSRIRLGNNVTIGAKAVVMPGVSIGDNSIVAVSAVVAKGTQIGEGECWGGIPARRLRYVGGQEAGLKP
jgi:hypothetical protein